MSAIDLLRSAREIGVRLTIDGSDLLLDADREPSPDFLEAVRGHKSALVALLNVPKSDWAASDWQAYFEERAGIAEFGGDLSRTEAEIRAFACCIIEWMERHPEPSQPDRCAWCDQPDLGGASVVPFGTQKHGHTWLHSECWEAWFSDRRERAEEALRVRFKMPHYAERAC
jgi:hypothetical protein